MKKGQILELVQQDFARHGWPNRHRLYDVHSSRDMLKRAASFCLTFLSPTLFMTIEETATYNYFCNNDIASATKGELTSIIFSVMEEKTCTVLELGFGGCYTSQGNIDLESRKFDVKRAVSCMLVIWITCGLSMKKAPEIVLREVDSHIAVVIHYNKILPKRGVHFILPDEYTRMLVCRKATLTWMLCKRFDRNVRTIIGRMIYATRGDECWGVRLRNKKQRLT